MSYDLALYFRSPEFPEKEWAEILSWFDAIERQIEPQTLEHAPYLRKEWFILVGEYGIFCSLEERYPRCYFADDKANWEISISAGSGLGLRSFFGYTLCYCTLSLIPETSAWDRGQHFDTLYQKPDKFLRKVNAVINSNFLYRTHKQRLKMQQLGVMDENFHLIPNPHVLKLAAQSDLYDE
jgi:hypothetical protein